MMDEIQNDDLEKQNEVLESQLEESQLTPSASQGRGKRGKRWVWILLGVLGFFVVLGAGAASGGAAAYFWLRDEVPAVRAAGGHEVILQTWSAGSQDEGVIVFHVQAGSPAEEAGLARGDIILSLDGQPVNSFMALSQRIRGYQAGDTVTLQVLHGDEERELALTLDEQGSRAFLGVSACIGPLGEEMTVQTGPLEFERGVTFMHAPGVLVTEVVAGGPAEGAGLRTGDWITALDDESVGAGVGLAELLQGYQPGDEVALTITRDGDEQTLTVELGDHPDNAGQAYLGIYYRPVGPEVMLDFKGGGRNFQLPALPFDEFQEGGQPPFFFHGMGEFQDLPEGYERSIILGEVLADSPADQAGLQAGDLILAVDEAPVDTIQAFVDGIQARQPGDEITLLVYRDGEQIELQATLAAHPDDADLGYLGVKATGFIRMERNRNQDLNQENEIKIPGDDA